MIATIVEVNTAEDLARIAWFDSHWPVVLLAITLFTLAVYLVERQPKLRRAVISLTSLGGAIWMGWHATDWAFWWLW